MRFRNYPIKPSQPRQGSINSYHQIQMSLATSVKKCCTHAVRLSSSRIVHSYVSSSRSKHFISYTKLGRHRAQLQCVVHPTSRRIIKASSPNQPHRRASRLAMFFLPTTKKPIHRQPRIEPLDQVPNRTPPRLADNNASLEPPHLILIEDIRILLHR